MGLLADHIPAKLEECFLRWVLSSIVYARRLLLKIIWGRLQDSTYKYYEIILVDIAHKVVREVRLDS